MSGISLYLDEDAMDMVLVTALRNRGIDVCTVNELQTTGDSDEEQLTLATKQERVLFSHNIADFCRLHSIFNDGKSNSLGDYSYRSATILYGGYLGRANEFDRNCLGRRSKESTVFFRWLY